MHSFSDLIRYGQEVLSSGQAKNPAALALALFGCRKAPDVLGPRLDAACAAYDETAAKAAEAKAKAEAEAQAKAEAEAKAKEEAEEKAREEAKAKANAKELRSLLQAVVDRYNDPNPKEDWGYGYIRDAAQSFLSAATDETVRGIFHTPMRHNKWNAAAYRGWEVFAEEDGKESYRKEDGSQPTEADWDRAFDLMVNVPIAYYWQYNTGHNKRVE